MRTRSIRAEDVRRDWFVVDAADRTLGRMATAIANRLRGKHKAEYTPNADTGDFVIVINAERVKVTGKKGTDKVYVRHTGYPGGIRNTPFNRMRETHPERIIEKAVKGMLPRNPLGRQMFRKLKVYAGPEHPHSAQQPRALEL